MKVAVDTSGDPLLATAAAVVKPHLLKPNGEELGELAGVDGDLEEDLERAIEASRRLVDSGVETVLATLGGKGGLLANADGVWHGAHNERVSPRSTVGAGDSTLSGFLLGELVGLDIEGQLRRAIAYGTAAVQLPGSTLPTPADVHENKVDVRRIA